MKIGDGLDGETRFVYWVGRVWGGGLTEGTFFGLERPFWKVQR